MATAFSITIAHADARYARQAAAEAFDELDRLEARLSAFRSDSDVSRIARLDAGGSCVVHPDTLECLRAALAVERATAGAFDIAYGTRPHCPASQLLTLGTGPPVVAVRQSGAVLDLGGIGKGFALDRMAQLLAAWDVASVLLRASASTVRAEQPPHGDAGWEIRFGLEQDELRAQLALSALSGSGRLVKGPHIIDPHAGQPAVHHQLAFATADTGAEADALSTAFVVMTAGAIRDFCGRHPEVGACVVHANQSTVEVLHEPPDVRRCCFSH